MHPSGTTRRPLPLWGPRPGDQFVMTTIVLGCLLVLSYRAYQTLGPAPQQIDIEHLPWQPLEFRIDINTTDGRPSGPAAGDQ